MSLKIKFSLMHLIFSILIALIIIGIVFLIWYPAPLTKATGVTEIFLMMIIIDMILGPFLTFIVYKEGKKNLKIDLSIIILIQMSALCYGVYSIAEGRPAWIVYSIDRFELIRKNDLIEENIEEVLPEYREVSLLGPKIVSIQLATNDSDRVKDMFSEVLGKISLAQRPEKYRAINQAKLQIKHTAKNLNELKQFNDANKVSHILSKYPKANAWIPLKATVIDMVVLVDKNNAEIIKIVDLRPWR